MDAKVTATTKRKSAHNEKRAARFTAEGLTAPDIRYARASYVGEGEAECSLCDHGIKYLYALTFDRPAAEGGAVRFEPVGSKCITDWFQAMPASPERDAVLAQVADLEREVAAEKRRMRAVEALAESLASSGDAADAAVLRRFVACAAARKSAEACDIAAKAVRHGGFASDRQASFFASLVRRAEGEANAVRGAACPACDGPMIARNGKRGPFLGCTSYPRCNGTREVAGTASTPRTVAPVGSPAPTAPAGAIGPACPDCEGPMRQRNGARGAFYGCAAFPRCRGTRQMHEVASGAAGDQPTANEAAGAQRDAEHASAAQGWAARKAPAPPARPSVLVAGGLRRVSAVGEVPAAFEREMFPEEAAPGPGYDATGPEEDAPF